MDLSAIRSNIGAILGVCGGGVEALAVVKAEGYGHGMIPVAKAARGAGVSWFGIATVAEGITLRDAGISGNIALLCHPAPDEAEAICRFDLTPTVGDWETLEAVAVAARRVGKNSAVHLEIDTGIGRSGVLPGEALSFWRRAVEWNLRVTGISAHFADPDSEESSFPKTQLDSFHKTRLLLEAAGARFDWVHVSSSAALLRFPGQSGNLVRPGLLLYGLHPGINSSIELRPALALKTRIATVRELPAGHNVSYGLTCTTTRPTRAATILIGYGDGYPRRLSNVGSVLLHGKMAPILGRVCMDQTVVDVTDIPEAVPGDIAVCIGKQSESEITAESLAALIETTVHEITTSLSARLPRIYTG